MYPALTLIYYHLVMFKKKEDFSIYFFTILVFFFGRLVGCPPFWHRRQVIMLRTIMEGRFSFGSPEWDDIRETAKDVVRWFFCDLLFYLFIETVYFIFTFYFNNHLFTYIFIYLPLLICWLYPFDDNLLLSLPHLLLLCRVFYLFWIIILY